MLFASSVPKHPASLCFAASLRRSSAHPDTSLGIEQLATSASSASSSACRPSERDGDCTGRLERREKIKDLLAKASVRAVVLEVPEGRKWSLLMAAGGTSTSEVRSPDLESK